MAERNSSSGTAVYVKDAELVAEIDAWIAKANGAGGDVPKWTRAMVVRAATRRWMAAEGAAEAPLNAGRGRGVPAPRRGHASARD